MERNENYSRGNSDSDYLRNTIRIGAFAGLVGLVVGGAYGFSEGKEIIQNIELLSQAPDFVKYSLNAASSLFVGISGGGHYLLALRDA